MPELPEVETVKRTLSPHLMGQKFTEIKIYHPAVIAYPDAAAFVKILTGRPVRSLDRRGKYLIFNLDENLDEAYCLVGHLRMTGRLILAGDAVPLAPHTHVVFSLDNGVYLHWVDVRRFGRLYLAREEEIMAVTGMAKLGPEPLGMSVEALAAICAGRRRPLKQLLLDQHLLAGIGNIYADEILFEAGLHPGREAGSLNRMEIERLQKAVQQVLRQAIANQGTTFRDYVDGSGRPGKNQEYLKAYGRTGKPCSRCGQLLERVILGGRSTHFCPGCQK
ncbi:MAG: bifunctional DNA-formamidopyrimidine glycosylase/DNA-(apurinic or apyrimidinic site) lyase [Clostridia bacterium]|nr:bifunctional DNA-formamidopyrimidine glycosylase/DNA-(apurinic or apyrimidinic site) lyase [Clostridia bacterium]